MPPLRLPRQEIHESIVEVHNRGAATPNFHKRWNDQQTALEGNADGVDASLGAVQAINAEQEQIILDLEDVVNEQAELLSEQIAINDRQDDQAGEIISITDDLIAAFEQQADFSAELADQANDIINALDVAFEAIADAETAQTAIEGLLVEFDWRIGASGTHTGTPDASGYIIFDYNVDWDDQPYINDIEYIPSLAGTLVNCCSTSFAVVQPTAIDETYLTVRLFDAAGAPITTGSWKLSYRIGVKGQHHT